MERTVVLWTPFFYFHLAQIKPQKMSYEASKKTQEINSFLMFVSLFSWFSANCPRAAINLDFPMNSPIWLI